MEGLVRASGREINISPKAAREICRLLKGKSIDKAKKILEEIVQMKRSVPYARYHKKVPHRVRSQDHPAGRYPVKAASEILKVVENLENNAINQGVDVGRFVITHARAHKGRVIKDQVPRAFGRSSPNFHVLVHIELAGREV